MELRRLLEATLARSDEDVKPWMKDVVRASLAHLDQCAEVERLREELKDAQYEALWFSNDAERARELVDTCRKYHRAYQ